MAYKTTQTQSNRTPAMEPNPKSKTTQQLDSSKLSETQIERCQDHILTENIWFVWSETSNSGEERRCYRCGTNERTLKIE